MISPKELELNEALFKRVWDHFFRGEKQGLLIRGKRGTGKTVLFMAFSRLLSQCMHWKRYAMIDNSDLYKSGIIDNLCALKEHNYRACFKYQLLTDMAPQNVLVDDFGRGQREYKKYGNTFAFEEEFIYRRYELFQQYGAQTHFITNLTKEQLLDKYADRIMSRINEMTQLIELKQTKDFRDEAN